MLKMDWPNKQHLTKAQIDSCLTVPKMTWQLVPCAVLQTQTLKTGLHTAALCPKISSICQFWGQFHVLRLPRLFVPLCSISHSHNQGLVISVQSLPYRYTSRLLFRGETNKKSIWMHSPRFRVPSASCLYLIICRCCMLFGLLRWPWTREYAFNAAAFLNTDDEIVGNAFGGYYNPGALGLDNVSKIFSMIYVLSSGRPVLIFQYLWELMTNIKLIYDITLIIFQDLKKDSK